MLDTSPLTHAQMKSQQQAALELIMLIQARLSYGSTIMDCQGTQLTTLEDVIVALLRGDLDEDDIRRGTHGR